MRIERFKESALSFGAFAEFGLGLVGSLPQCSLDRRPIRWLAQRALRSLQKLFVDFNRGSLDHAHRVSDGYVHIDRWKLRMGAQRPFGTQGFVSPGEVLQERR